MGTRSITRVQVDGKTLIAVYRQFDGYIRGHGKDLANFLEGRRIVNGYNPGTEKEVFNGAGCLAANLISFLKKEEFGKAGTICIQQTDADDEEYSYNINIKSHESGKWYIEYESLPEVTVFHHKQTLFNGSSEEYLNYVNNEINR